MRNYWYQNTLHLYSHYHENQVIFMIFMGKRFAQAFALHMETQTVEVKVCIHSFLLTFYKNVVFRAQAEHSYFSTDFRLKTFLYYS